MDEILQKINLQIRTLSPYYLNIDKLIYMNRILLLCLLFLTNGAQAVSVPTFRSNGLAIEISFVLDTLPKVLTQNHADLVESRLRSQAIIKFGIHQLPSTLKEWELYRTRLRNSIIEKTGFTVQTQLALNIRETGSTKMKGYTVKNIAFQTRPGVYATANLYVPDGNGPFPAVVNMIGHWTKAKIDTAGPQQIGHSLARNGYVCLSIDPWGAGERGTVHGEFEYHGANLGASFLNIGETLLGIQISDNMRGVDLLSSLPYVDRDKIGATGASGGGNQTMWLAAMDERVKAAVPVVSVGTFESYVMRSNCICESLPDGLTFTEESGILALIAPRALKMCNHKQDSSPAFFPSEMQRSFKNAQPIFKLLNAENKISYQVFDKTHGYFPEDREVMLGWFDLHLKGVGTGAAKEEQTFDLLPEDQLLVYPAGKRDPLFVNTSTFLKVRGTELRSDYLNKTSFDPELKRKELASILRINDPSHLKTVHKYESQSGWDRMVLETADAKLIPILHLSPSNPSMGYTLITDPEGKDSISYDLIRELKNKGYGIVLMDLSGTGETYSLKEILNTKSMPLHTVSRAELWLGKTMMGEWVKELALVSNFLKTSYNAQSVNLDGSKESGLAGLFLAATGGNVDNLTLRYLPLTYLFDNRENINFFSMAIHLPGFLNWGDVSLAAALSNKQVRVINPVSMSGERISDEALRDYIAEFAKVRKLSKQAGQTVFK